MVADLLLSELLSSLNVPFEAEDSTMPSEAEELKVPSEEKEESKVPFEAEDSSVSFETQQPIRYAAVLERL